MGTLSQKSHFLGQIFFSSTNSILDLLITCLNCLDFQLPTILTLFHHFITRKGILGLLPALLDMLHHLHQLLLLSTSKAHSKTHTSDNPGQPCVIISVDHRERYICIYSLYTAPSLLKNTSSISNIQQKALPSSGILYVSTQLGQNLQKTIFKKVHFMVRNVTKSSVSRYQAKFAKTVPEHLKVCHIWLINFF